jgi:hypothetical protein
VSVDGAFSTHAGAEPAPLRQGRRRLLRPDLGAAQVGARLESRCRALLVLPHARRRRRSALPGPAHRAHGDGKTSAWPIRAPAQIALEAAATYERLGSPEGELALAEAVLYLALAAKSNAAYVAYNAARAFVAKDGSRPVPEHLRNAPTRLMKELGYGKDYRYAHDEAGAYAAGENYFPEGMPPVDWYQPVARGLEIKDRREARAPARARPRHAEEGCARPAAPEPRIKNARTENAC